MAVALCVDGARGSAAEGVLRMAPAGAGRPREAGPRCFGGRWCRRCLCERGGRRRRQGGRQGAGRSADSGRSADAARSEAGGDRRSPGGAVGGEDRPGGGAVAGGMVGRGGGGGWAAARVRWAGAGGLGWSAGPGWAGGARGVGGQGAVGCCQGRRWGQLGRRGPRAAGREAGVTDLDRRAVDRQARFVPWDHRDGS